MREISTKMTPADAARILGGSEIRSCADPIVVDLSVEDLDPDDDGMDGV